MKFVLMFSKISTVLIQTLIRDLCTQVNTRSDEISDHSDYAIGIEWYTQEEEIQSDLSVIHM